MADMLAQVLTAAQADAYRSNRAGAGIDPRRVSGFVLRLADLAGLGPEGILSLARAGHPDVAGAPAQYRADPLSVLVFGAGADVRGCLISSAATEVGGTLDADAFAAPYTGHALLAGGDGRLAAEFLVNGSALLPIGAELRAVDIAGSRTLAHLGVAADGSATWLPGSGPTAAVALREPGERQLFAEIGGRRVPAFQVGPDAVGVLAPDSRSAWLCFPAAAEYSPTPLGCLAITPLTSVDAIWRAETWVTWRGHTLLAEAVEAETVRVLHLGRPLPEFAGAGFAGDQYHGFRAVLPRAEVTGYDPQAGFYSPGRRPVRTDSAAPFLRGENRRFHNGFAVEAGLAPVPCWSAPDPHGVPRTVFRAPDYRAALVMHPDLTERWHDADGGVLLPLPLGTAPALAATLVTTGAGEFVVEGADGESLIARAVGSDAAAAPVRLAPQSVTRREDALVRPQRG